MFASSYVTLFLIWSFLILILRCPFPIYLVPYQQEEVKTPTLFEHCKAKEVTFNCSASGPWLEKLFPRRWDWWCCEEYFSKKYTSTNYNLYLRTFWKKLFYFFIQANHLQTTSVSPPNKTPPQCWGLDHRDPRERELILWISLERDDYAGSSTPSPLVGEGKRRESSSLSLETGGRRDSSSLFLARGGRRGREGGTNLPS